jgi:hypothetical protein
MKKNPTTLFDVPIEQLKEEQAASELAELANIIAHHDRLYYEKDQPEITDAEYDSLRRRNDVIEARFPHLVLPNSPSIESVRNRSRIQEDTPCRAHDLAGKRPQAGSHAKIRGWHSKFHP